jgi:drug/metabolite transporter (DMT)-like permease
MIPSNLLLPKLFQGFVIILAVIAVAIADVLLKRAAANGSVLVALRSPWMVTAIGLYLLQISLFTIAFIAGWKLSMIGALQTALYALIVLAAGVVLYHEHLSRTQVIGILLAFGGVVLINWP